MKLAVFYELDWDYIKKRADIKPSKVRGLFLGKKGRKWYLYIVCEEDAVCEKKFK